MVSFCVSRLLILTLLGLLLQQGDVGSQQLRVHLGKKDDSRAFMDEKTTKLFNQLSWYHQHMSSSHES